MYQLPIFKVTFQGKPLSQEEFDKKQEIHHLYPTSEKFMKEYYIPLLEGMRDTGEQKTLEISEEGIVVT